MIYLRKIILVFMMSFFIFFGVSLPLYAQDKTGAENLAEKIARQKRVQQEQREMLVEGHTVKGIVLYKEGEYYQALEEFLLAQKFDPYNKEVSQYIDNCRQRIDKIATKHFLKGGKLYKKGKLVEAADEFGLVSEISVKYKESQGYLARIEEELGSLDLEIEVKEVKEIREPKDKEKSEVKSRQQRVAQRLRELEKQKMATELLKKAQEATMMLEVDEAYLPPPKREHKEEEEVETPEEKKEREEAEAKAKLIEQMKSITVPALSLTDADIRDVIRQLMNMTGVTIVLDETALSKVAGAGAVRITFTTVNPMPLLDLLELTLKATGLGYKVEPTYIWISDKDTLTKEELVTRVYKLKYGVKKTRSVSVGESSEGAEEW